MLTQRGRIVFIVLLSVVYVSAVHVVSNALDPAVWLSQVSAVYEDGSAVPVQCHFKNVYVDVARIFLQPVPLVSQKAAVDLYDCCVNIENEITLDRKKCGRSVDWGLCACVSNFKYVFSVMPSVEPDGVPIRNVSGISWLMHHWSPFHHPDHFGMKILELHAYLYHSRKSNKGEWHEFFPGADIETLVSMDYPGPSTYGDYETMLMEFLNVAFAKQVSVTAVNMNNAGHKLEQHFFSAQESRLLSPHVLLPLCVPFIGDERHMSKDFIDTMESFLGLRPLTGQRDPIVFPVNDSLVSICTRLPVPDNSKIFFPLVELLYLENAYSSPRYKNNIPPPFEDSSEALETSLKLVSANRQSRNISTEGCKCVSKASANIKVAVILRSDGSGRRAFVNLHDVLYILQDVTKQPFIDTLFISGHIPALTQAHKFCEYHLIVSPHSSQLSNLVFSPRGISIIELQNEQLIENTFMDLGRKLGLHYQLLKSGNEPVLGEDNHPAPLPGTHPKMANQKVHLENFKKAVVVAVEHLQSNGWIKSKF